jgi:hypothetical protein
MVEWPSFGVGARNVTFQSDLDAMLRSDGQQVTLRRVVGTTNQANVDCTCRALVRGYRADELAGGIIQGDSLVILSATDIERAQWPGGQPVTSPPNGLDVRVPKKNDKIIIMGRPRNIEAADPVYVDGQLHRINVTVRG